MTSPKDPKNQPKVKLVGLTIGEGSFVDRGDNPGAPLRFWKSRDGEPDPQLEDDLSVDLPGMSRLDKLARFFGVGKFAGGVPFEARTTSEIMAADRFREEFWKLRGAFLQSVDSIVDMAPSEEMAFKMQQTVDEFVLAAKALAADVTKGAPEAESDLLDILERLQQTTSVAGKAAKDVPLEKRQEEFANALAALEDFEPPDPPEDEMPAEKKTHTKAVADILAKLGDEDRVEIEAAIEAAPAPEVPPVVAPVTVPEGEAVVSDETMKSLPPEVRKMLEETQAIAKAAEAKADALEKAALDASYLAKAAKLGVDGVDKQNVAKLFEAADKSDPETKEAILSTVKGLAERAKKGAILLKSIGSANGAGDATDAEQKTMQAAKALQKEKPAMTYEQAYAEVLRTDKSLYSDMESEREELAAS